MDSPEDPMKTITMPPVWFRLPPGFHHISPEDRASVDFVADALGSPDARQQLSQIMDKLDELTHHDVVHTSVGLHPGESDDLCTSLFSLTGRLSPYSDPRLGVARTALAIAGSTLWNSSACRFIDLPSQQPCAMVAGSIKLPEQKQEMFQARVSMQHPTDPYLLILDLTSAATVHADAYTDIIEAVAYTVSAIDPTPTAPDGPNTSRILEVLL
ncbi:hypothetical protein ACQEVM_11470 [Streptomyces sp. CA-243310]|uniref:hypothetical protein n=1 Tax=Streptomyces sp. CA-243310 TaxID=3240056 RepID=UPI003D9049AD